MPNDYVYGCECNHRPGHSIPGMTSSLYYELVLKYGVNYYVRAADCPAVLRPGQVVVEQTATFKVVGPPLK